MKTTAHIIAGIAKLHATGQYDHYEVSPLSGPHEGPLPAGYAGEAYSLTDPDLIAALTALADDGHALPGIEAR